MAAIKSNFQTVTYFLRLGRPLFLLGGFLLYGLGVTIALYSGVELSLPVLFWGQVAVTATQLMTHYSNDYFDLAADKANPTPTRWSGGSRILAEGYVRPQVALATAVVMGTVALFATVWLAFVLRPGPLTLPLLILAITLTWSYSSPPLHLNRRGLGEVTGAIAITGMTPVVGYYLQAGVLELLPFLAVFPLCCFQFLMLLVVNLPDAAGDATAGKHTLVHFLGTRGSVSLYLAVLLLAYSALPLLVLMGLPILVAVALLAISPLAIWQGWRMYRGAWADPQLWDSLGFWSIGLLIASVLAELLAFILLYLNT
jgi:1,4-dihydroxy-2-naphthoate octaprenyltransferase